VTRYMLQQDIKVTPGRKKKGRQGRRNRLKGVSGQGAKEKPPIFGMIFNEGKGGDRDAINVQQTNIAPLIKQPSFLGSLIYTDVRHLHPLSKWGYEHKRCVMVEAVCT